MKPELRDGVARLALISLFLGSVPVNISTAKAQVKSERKADGLIGAVKTVRGRTAYLINENGQLPQEVPAISHTVAYDITGRSLERADFLPDGSTDTRSTSKYDTKGQEIEHAYYVHDSLVYRTVKTYNTKGREIQSIDYRANGSVNAKFISTYKQEGRLRETKERDTDGRLRRRLLFRLNGKNRIVEKLEYEADGTLHNKSIYAYDAKGNKTEETNYYKSNGSFRNSKDTFVYDTDGRLTEQAVYLDGVLSSRETSKYDRRGNVVENIRYDGDGTVEEIASWNYQDSDSRGNWTKAVGRVSSKRRQFPADRTMVAYREISYFDERNVAASRID